MYAGFSAIDKERYMTIKVLEMEIHEEYVFNHGTLLQVGFGGWICETRTYKNDM